MAEREKLLREGSEKAAQQFSRPINLPNVDPFVRSMGLGDIARTEEDAGNMGVRQNARVAEVIDAKRFVLVDGTEKLPNQMLARIGFEGVALTRMKAPDSR